MFPSRRAVKLILLAVPLCALLLIETQSFVIDTQAHWINNAGYPAAAGNFFNFACSIGSNSDACFWLRLRREVLSKKQVADLSNAVSLYSQSCDGGDEVDCLTLGTMYEYGVGSLRITL